MNVTLVGGAGFIGHNLALALRSHGIAVTVVDGLQLNHLGQHSENPRSDGKNDLYLRMLNDRLDLLRDADIAVHVQDARDPDGLQKLLARIKPEVIVHLAACAHANKANKNPRLVFEHNARTLENVLEYSREGGVDRVVFFSSSMVYGNFAEDSVTEESIANPLGFYGEIKLAGERLVIAYQRVFGVPYTIVRPSALYGERCVSGRVGQLFIENALQDKELTIHGDGEERLDFTYVRDLVHGVICVLQSEAAANQIFNLTFGESRSTRQMVEILKCQFPEVKIAYAQRDHLRPKRGTLCVDKAREMIGYDPQFRLEDGYPKYIEWYRRFWDGAE